MRNPFSVVENNGSSVHPSGIHTRARASGNENRLYQSLLIARERSGFSPPAASSRLGADTDLAVGSTPCVISQFGTGEAGPALDEETI